MTLTEECGMVFNPLRDSWALSQRDLDVNYLMVATKEK